MIQEEWYQSHEKLKDLISFENTLQSIVLTIKQLSPPLLLLSSHLS